MYSLNIDPLNQCRKQGAFTLIELLIALVIIGVLAAIAIPAYTQYVIRSNRAAAQSYLMDIVQRQQQYLIDSRAYAPNLETLNISTPDKVASFYNITLTIITGPPPAFSVTATPIAGSAQASDGGLSIDSTGAKTPSTKW